MLEASVSALIPKQDSESFYTKFYNQYNLFQINDILISAALERLPEGELKSLISILDGYNGDHGDLAVNMLGMGIMDPVLMRRRKESQVNLRGLSTDIFEQLVKKGIDPLLWYKDCMEFLMLYSICEQAMKDFVNQYNSENNKSMQEDKIIYRLFESLVGQNLKEKYIKELSDNTSGILKSQNDVQAGWMYFTVIRHCLMHSGGRCTEKIKQKMESVLLNNKSELDVIEDAMATELLNRFPDGFFINILDKDFLIISDDYLNFFRNFVVAIVESAERSVHPDDFALQNFDPYKL